MGCCGSQHQSPWNAGLHSGTCSQGPGRGCLVQGAAACLQNPLHTPRMLMRWYKVATYHLSSGLQQECNRAADQGKRALIAALALAPLAGWVHA